MVWSVLAGLFWSISFGLYCSGLFLPVPSWQVLSWFGFSYSPCCVGSNLLSSVLLCSSPVYPFLFAFVWFIVLFRSALVQAVLFSLVWSVLAGLFWFGTFGMYCSGLFSPVRSWQVLAWFGFWRVPSCVGCQPFLSRISLVGLLRFGLVSLGFVLSGSFLPVLVWSTTLCSTLVYSCSFVLVAVARI